MSERYGFGRFTLSVGKRRLERDGVRVDLGAPAFDILVALLRKPGETVRSGDLARIAWPDTAARESLLRVHIAALRKALGETNPARSSILNVRGEGYRFAHVSTRYDVTAQMGSQWNPLIKLIGRKAIVSSLCGLLSKSLFLTITGAGGVGKTAVAQAIGDKLRGKFRDDVVFLDFSRFPPESIPSEEIWPSLLPEEQSNLDEYFAGRQSIFILDGCEHLLAKARRIAGTIRRHAPLSAIIATSREPLAIEYENVRPLEALEFPELSADQNGRALVSYPAAELFFDRACANVGSFDIDDAVGLEIAELCRLVEGNPLALELAAMRVDQFGIPGLVDRIKLDPGLLSGGKRTAHHRQKSMVGSIEWSIDLLDPDEKLAMRALAFFSGSFSLASAGSVLAANRSIGRNPEELIERLIGKSLLSRDRSAGAQRYRMSFMVREVMQMRPRTVPP